VAVLQDPARIALVLRAARSPPTGWRLPCDAKAPLALRGEGGASSGGVGGDATNRFVAQPHPAPPPPAGAGRG
jgi:hypothetical protein